MSAPTTYDIAALEALRERVREATRSSLELDCAIQDVFDPEYGTFGWRPWSASLDACAALQAELWPGSLREVEYHGNVCRVFVWGPGFGWLYYEDHRHGECLAWLSAILSALIAMHREARTDG